MTISVNDALEARGWLIQAVEAALISMYVKDEQQRNHLKKFRRCLENAVEATGYRLVPITQDKPDSGRTSIPETEPEAGEQV